MTKLLAILDNLSKQFILFPLRTHSSVFDGVESDLGMIPVLPLPVFPPANHFMTASIQILQLKLH